LLAATVEVLIVEAAGTIPPEGWISSFGVDGVLDR